MTTLREHMARSKLNNFQSGTAWLKEKDLKAGCLKLGFPIYGLTLNQDINGKGVR
jgi:hypothetical protein